MDRVTMLRGAVAPANAPVLASVSVEPVIPLRPDIAAVYAQLTDKSLDSLDRLQRYFYELKAGGLLELGPLDQFGGHFTNQTDSILNLTGGTAPVAYGAGWTAADGFKMTGKATVSVTPASGTKNFTVVSTDKKLVVGMGIVAAGIPNGSYITSAPTEGGAGAYSFNNAENLNATASATVAGQAGSFVTFITPGATKYSMNSAHISFSLVEGGAGSQPNDPFIGYMPASGAVTDALRIRFGDSGGDIYRFNSTGSTTTIATPDLPGHGHFIINRPTGSRVEVWYNGELAYANDAAPANALPMKIAWGRNAGVFQNMGWKTSSHGAGLTAAQCVSLFRASTAV